MKVIYRYAIPEQLRELLASSIGDVSEQAMKHDEFVWVGFPLAPQFSHFEVPTQQRELLMTEFNCSFGTKTLWLRRHNSSFEPSSNQGCSK